MRGMGGGGGDGRDDAWRSGAPGPHAHGNQPQPAQPRHTNDGAPRTRKRHQQEHRPQRPSERSDPTQHAKGRPGDCPGPRKETATRRNVTRGGGGQEQASFMRIKLQWGGGLGGWVFSRVGGSKALDPPPLIILRVSWVGLLPHLLSLVTGALSGCLLVPLSVVSLCRWQVCRWQFFTWRPCF